MAALWRVGGNKWRRAGVDGASVKWGKLTERAKRVVILAYAEAAIFGNEDVAPEHLLLGLIREGGVASEVFERLRVDTARVSEEVTRRLEPTRSGPIPIEEVKLHPRTERVMDFIHDEANRSCTSFPGTEHILLGLLREEDGVAYDVLAQLGLTIAAARAETFTYLGGYIPGEPGSRSGLR